MAKIDIHNYEKRYAAKRQAVLNAQISGRNKQLIFDFEKTCFLREQISISRRIVILNMLVILARDYSNKNFDKLEKKDIEDIVLKINSRNDLSPWTKQGYRVIIKKFFKWLYQGENYKTTHDYPEIVRWINTNIKKKDKPKVKASELLTELEVKRIISAAEHPRDQAFMSMLYELGARIGEIGNLFIKHLAKDDYSYIVDLSGKTGHRTPRIVISDPYITAWLNNHPGRDNPNCPMWLMLGKRNKDKAMP